MRTLPLTQDLDFGFQIDPARGPGALLDDLNEIQDISRSGAAVVDNEIAVLVRDNGAADAGAFQPQFINQFAGGNRLWILEDTSGAGSCRLRFPTLLAEG